MAYHKRKINKGVLGEPSKIREEFEEFEDAVEQQDIILQLCELSDMLGAIESYVIKFNISLGDLREFSDKTKESFKDGTR